MPVLTNDDVADQLRRAGERALHAVEEAAALFFAKVARFLEEAAARLAAQKPREPMEDTDDQLLAAMERYYTSLKQDPVAWGKYKAEQDLWDHATGDGLSRA
ncbi:MAG: hypothetical protein ABR946_06250 [Solirubrobacteraceae bacterium]|jgi:hypothetical protein